MRIIRLTTFGGIKIGVQYYELSFKELNCFEKIQTLIKR